MHSKPYSHKAVQPAAPVNLSFTPGSTHLLIPLSLSQRTRSSNEDLNHWNISVRVWKSHTFSNRMCETRDLNSGSGREAGRQRQVHAGWLTANQVPWILPGREASPESPHATVSKRMSLWKASTRQAPPDTYTRHVSTRTFTPPHIHTRICMRIHTYTCTHALTQEEERLQGKLG